MKTTQNKTIYWIRRTRWLHTLALLIVVSLFALFHHLNYGKNLSVDWSKNQRNTLTQGSIDLLQRFKQPIVFKAYYEQRADLRTQIHKAVSRYQRVKPDIHLEFISTTLPREEIARMGFSQLGQTIIEYGERKEQLSRLDEKSISQALFNLIRTNQPWLIMLQGHGERDPYDEGVHGYSQWRGMLESSGMKVQTLNLLSTPFIPDNTSLLIIAGANADFAAGELELIRDYVESGRNLFFLTDPDSSANINQLYSALGVKKIPGVIIDANVQLRNLLGIKHPAVVPVIEYQRHSINFEIKHQTLFPFAHGLQANDETDWKMDALFYSHSRSWSETGNILDEELVFEQDKGDTQGPLVISAAITRMHNNHNQRIVIVGDSDFIANGYIGQGANATLAMNMVNWQNEDEQLISITPPRADDQITSLDNKTIIALALIFLLIMPAVLIAIGAGIYWRQSRL